MSKTQGTHLSVILKVEQLSKQYKLKCEWCYQ